MLILCFFLLCNFLLLLFAIKSESPPDYRHNNKRTNSNKFFRSWIEFRISMELYGLFHLCCLVWVEIKMILRKINSFWGSLAHIYHPHLSQNLPFSPLFSQTQTLYRIFFPSFFCRGWKIYCFFISFIFFWEGDG